MTGSQVRPSESLDSPGLRGRGMSSPSIAPQQPRLAWALTLVALPWLSGCLVIENKTKVIVVPPDSKEVRMYYVFEGLSCLNDSGTDKRSLERAKIGLKALQKEDFS